MTPSVQARLGRWETLLIKLTVNDGLFLSLASPPPFSLDWLPIPNTRSVQSAMMRLSAADLTRAVVAELGGLRRRRLSSVSPADNGNGQHPPVTCGSDSRHQDYDSPPLLSLVYCRGESACFHLRTRPTPPPLLSGCEGYPSAAAAARSAGSASADSGQPQDHAAGSDRSPSPLASGCLEDSLVAIIDTISMAGLAKKLGVGGTASVGRSMGAALQGSVVGPLPPLRFHMHWGQSLDLQHCSGFRDVLIE